ncbi:MAG: undecaprenyl-diphosphate phosphatase [Candidatus Pacearchaeota archaeon]
MFNEILLSFIQAATEFLPISSSGHLALASLLLKQQPNLFFITILHLASLLAVLIFVRKEIIFLLKFGKESRKLWGYLIIATIPAALVGYFLKDMIEGAFSSLLFLGVAFLFTGFVLFLTKFFMKKEQGKEVSIGSSIFIGIFQALAIFPGVSRSGMTISSSLFSGFNREKAVKFSFLLFIPVSLGAFLLEVKDTVISNFLLTTPVVTLVISFIVCLILSLVFLSLLFYIVKKERFWLFSFYCWLVGVICLFVYFL